MPDYSNHAFNDQGIHKTVFSITNIPESNIAELSNIHHSCESDKYTETRVSLNPIDLNFCDFINLFYGVTSGAFRINPSCSSSLAISLTKQTYSTTQSKILKFNIYDQILKAYSKNKNLPEGSAPLDSTLKLERETFLTNSLINLKGRQIALSLDEVLENLISRDLIEPTHDGDSCAKVKFVVTGNYYYLPLSVKLAIVFTYVTDIPGFKNTSHISYPNIQCHYSKNENIVKPNNLSSNNFTLNKSNNISRNFMNPSYFLDEEVDPQSLKNTVSFSQDNQLNTENYEDENTITNDDDSVGETVNQLKSIINGEGDDQITITTKENHPW